MGHSTCVTVNQNLVAAIRTMLLMKAVCGYLSIALQGIRLIKPEIGESFVIAWV